MGATVPPDGSGHVAGTAPAVLPLSVVRFTPPLDPRGRAPKGQTFSIPVQVQRQAGSGSPGSTRLTVDVSYDHGASWHPAIVHNGQTRSETVARRRDAAGPP